MSLYNPTEQSIKQATDDLNLDNDKNIKLGEILTEDTHIDGESNSFNLKSNMNQSTQEFFGLSTLTSKDMS